MKNAIFFTGLRWLWLTLIILIIDFVSKRLILNNFQLYEYVYLISYLNLTYVQNYGAAFSFLANKNGWQRWFFIFISIIICIIIIILMYHQKANKKLSNISYALIIGGALGNLCDRLIITFVIDFIDFHIGDWHWPIFNIADIAICIGVLFNIFDSYFSNYNRVNKT